MSDPSTGDAERRSRLHGVRLRALVAEHLGTDVHVEAEPFPDGAALVVDGAAWIAVEGPADRKLGRTLAWAIRHGGTSLHLVAGEDTGQLARRAARFRMPIEVWFAEGRTLLPAPPEPLTPPPLARPSHLALTELIEAAGATPNVEHGVVFGEVRGLEVCRVVDQPTIGHVTEPPLVPSEPSAAGPDTVILEVGVGATDREAFQILHGEIPTLDALRSVVAAVARHRRDDAPQHPLNRLATERFLRWRIEQEPEAIGLAAVEPAQPPVPRPSLNDPAPCVAAASDRSGREVTVVCSTGVDLDLAPYVGDVHAAYGRDVVVVTPHRDLVPITKELVGLLDVEVELVGHG